VFDLEVFDHFTRNKSCPICSFSVWLRFRRSVHRVGGLIYRILSGALLATGLLMNLAQRARGVVGDFYARGESALHGAGLAKYVAVHEIATIWMVLGAVGHRWSACT
jgi:hypothetical protein